MWETCKCSIQYIQLKAIFCLPIVKSTIFKIYTRVVTEQTYYQKARNPMDVLFLFSLAIPYDTDIYWQHAYVDRASTTLAVCLPPSSYRPCAAMPKWLHQKPKLFLACVPGIQSLLNGSSAFANQILLRIDPLLRPLLQFLDGFHTIQFSRRSIILQWRVFGTKNFVQ